MASLIDVIEQVRSRVAPGVDGSSLQEFDFVIEQTLPVALKEVAIKVAESNDEAVKAHLQKDFTAALTAGKAPLAGLLSAVEPALLRFPFQRVSHSSLSYPLLQFPSLFRLQLEPANPDFAGYTIEGGQVHTKDTTGSLTGLTGNLNITAQYVPTLASLPNTLLPLLVEEVVSALKGISFETNVKPLLESYSRATGETE
jgi:hypothetical protein